MVRLLWRRRRRRDWRRRPVSSEVGDEPRGSMRAVWMCLLWLSGGWSLDAAACEPPVPPPAGLWVWGPLCTSVRADAHQLESVLGRPTPCCPCRSATGGQPGRRNRSDVDADRGASEHDCPWMRVGSTLWPRRSPKNRAWIHRSPSQLSKGTSLQFEGDHVRIP